MNSLNQSSNHALGEGKNEGHINSLNDEPNELPVGARQALQVA